MRAMTCLLACLLLAGPAPAQSPDPIRIGVLNDQSGMYADLAGPGSVVAARMAVEDAGGAVLGRRVEVVAADHQPGGLLDSARLSQRLVPKAQQMQLAL